MSAVTSADWCEHLEEIERRAFVARDPRELNVDPKPGYYVSALRDRASRDYRLAEGPFATHAEALVAVAGVRLAWGNADVRACWYAWGTCRIKEVSEHVGDEEEGE